MSLRYFSILLYVSLLCFSVNCDKDDTVLNPGKPVTFEIYISSDDISEFEPVQLDEITLIEPPLLSLSDISGYNWKKHHITYSESVWAKLKAIDDLLYKYFVLKVNDERIYWGRFLRDNSSEGSENPVIPLIQDSEGKYIIPDSILIEKKYLSYALTPNDPRNDLRIYNAISETGILVEDDSPYPIPPQNIFSIYLTEQNYPSDASVQLEDMTLIEPPLLTSSDITSYRWGNHYISYPDSTWERMKTRGNLLHKIFIVSVGDERIYWGCFLDLVDWISSPHPVIWLIPRHPDGRNVTPGAIVIVRESPIIDPPSIIPDPRDNSRIYNALVEAGVLVDLDVSVVAQAE